MDETVKHTDSNNNGSKRSSRVVDVSWAADYINDEWEQKNSARGAFDTQVIEPLNERLGKGKNRDGASGKVISTTQRLKASDDDVKIVDAMTDKTIVNADETEKVREAMARGIDVSDSDGETIKIRDAMTDITVTSIDDAKAVRKAAVMMGLDEDLDDLEKIRDARTGNLKPVSLKPIGKFNFKKPEPKKDDEIPDPELFVIEEDRGSAKTIVASDDVKKVRNAVEERFPEEDFPDDFDDEYYDDYIDEEYYGDREETRPDRNIRYERNVRRHSSGRHSCEPGGQRKIYNEQKSPLRFIPLVLVIALCIFGAIAAKEICHDVPLNSSDYSKVRYTVEEGLTDEQLAEDLVSLGIIDNPLIFRLRCLFYSAKYVEGTYEISPCYSTEKIINILSGYTYGND